MPIRILVADPHDVVRQGVRAILSCRPHYEVCGEATNGQEAVAAARELRPHVAILDLLMPVINGLAAAEEIVEFGLHTNPDPHHVRSHSDARGRAERWCSRDRFQM